MCFIVGLLFGFYGSLDNTCLMSLHDLHSRSEGLINVISNIKTY